jgi:predicted O-methyltransferase YrrM
MLAAGLALARRPGPAERAVGGAMRAAAFRSPDAEERRWIEAIEDRRAAVAALRGVRTPDEVGVYDIALAVQWMSVPPVLGRLLLQLVRRLRPAMCLEVGTGFGISAAYIGAGLELSSAGRLVSVDVDPRPVAIAREGFRELGLERVSASAGPPSEGLAEALEECGDVQFAFVDADHRTASTMRTMSALEPRLAAGAVVVLDDVSSAWRGMEDAWTAIRSSPRLRSGLRLGRFGIVFCDGRRPSPDPG